MEKSRNWENLPSILSVEETAKFVGYGQARIRELCRSKRIPCIRLGRAYRIPKDALHAWVTAECQAPQQDYKGVR